MELDGWIFMDVYFLGLLCIDWEHTLTTFPHRSSGGLPDFSTCLEEKVEFCRGQNVDFGKVNVSAYG